MTGPKPRRSRRAWAAPGTPDPIGVPLDEGAATKVRVPMRLLDKLLLLAVAGLLLAVAALTFFVYQQQEYIAGKGAQRDAENARLHEQIRASICDLLDQLPEGGLLDRPRAQYGCGPGIPVSQLTPQEQQQVTSSRASSAAPMPRRAAPTPPAGSAALRAAASPSPSPAPPRTSPATPASPSPTPPPPVTGAVCDLLGVCLP